MSSELAAAAVANGPTTAVVFDFDMTLVDDTVDTVVVEKLGSAATQATLKKSHADAKAVWCDAMSDALAKMQKVDGVSLAKIDACLAGVPVADAMKQAVLEAGDFGARLFLISNSNEYFIRTVLEANLLGGQFAAIYSNHANVVDGKLVIQRRVASTDRPHACPRCPVNLCKGLELRDFAKGFDRIIYIGDSKSDVCPTLHLAKSDFVLARAGLGLQKYWDGQLKSETSPTVRSWKNAQELLDELRRVLNGPTGNTLPASSSKRLSVFDPMTVKLENNESSDSVSVMFDWSSMPVAQELVDDDQNDSMDTAVEATVMQPKKSAAGKLVRTLSVQGSFAIRATGVIMASVVKAPRREAWSRQASIVIMTIQHATRDQTANIKQIRNRAGLSTLPTISGTTVEKGKVRNVKCEWITHASARNSNRVLLFLHGGAYVAFHPPFYRLFTSNLSRSACARVLAVDYRLAPEHPYPAGLDDSYSIYRWLISAEGANVSASDVIIAGDSAGGGMACAVCLRARQDKLPMPAAMVLFSPWVNVNSDEPSWETNSPFDILPNISHGVLRFAKAYAGEASMNDPFISPLFADLTGFPPMLVLNGEVELLLDQGVRWVEKARKAGAVVTHHIEKDMIHVYQLLSMLFPKQMAKSMQLVNEHVNRHIPLSVVRGSR